MRFLIASILLLWIFNYATCKYGTKDTAPIPEEIKNFRVTYFDNKAQYVNPRLSQQVTDRLRQKIINTTRLTQTNNDDAHYDISGLITQYYVTTTGISGTQASTNRLNVGVHLIFKNTLNPKGNLEADVIKTFDFASSLSLTQAEVQLNEEIVRNIVDEIFNKIFSNW